MVNYTNFSDFTTNFWEYAFRGYYNALGFLFYPLILGGIIGYVYVKTQSALAATVAILLVFVGYGATGIFANISPFIIFLQIVATLSTVGIIILFLSRWRK